MGEHRKAELGAVNAALSSAHPRQREVLALIAEGRDNAAIARHLGLPLQLVKSYVSTLYTLLPPPAGVNQREWLASQYRHHLAERSEDGSA